MIEITFTVKGINNNFKIVKEENDNKSNIF